MKVEDFSVRLVHLNNGWRYWAFMRATGEDDEHGLCVDGYGSQEAADAAILDVVERENRKDG